MSSNTSLDPRIHPFLSKHRISVISILLPDQSVHSACLHYSHTLEPFNLYFNTKKDSRKCQSLLTGNSVKSSIVVGMSEEEWIEFQLNGEMQMLDQKADIELAKTTHFLKYADYRKYETDPHRVFLRFMPTWWRYTEFRSEPKVMIESV